MTFNAEFRSSSMWHCNLYLALRKAKELKYTHGIAESFCNKSRTAKHCNDDFVRSETFDNESLYWFQKSFNKKGLDDLYSYLWYTAFSQSRFDEALGYIEEKYLIAKENSDTAQIFETLQH